MLYIYVLQLQNDKYKDTKYANELIDEIDVFRFNGTKYN